MIKFSTFTSMQRKLLLSTISAFALLFFVSSAGINGSNDGSHFALAKSIYYNQSTEIKPFFNYVKCCDYAVKNGKLYSFWVSPDKSGASYGYLGAGGKGYDGVVDHKGINGY